MAEMPSWEEITAAARSCWPAPERLVAAFTPSAECLVQLRLREIGWHTGQQWRVANTEGYHHEDHAPCGGSRSSAGLDLRSGRQAQTTLRVGLAEDPDILDPTLARTYFGRIVFAALCDKLFDIDEKLNIVPQLALGYEIFGDGKVVTVKLRPGVKFHDGEPLDAEAVKFSLLRHLTMTGSFRKPEISVVERVEVSNHSRCV